MTSLLIPSTVAALAFGGVLVASSGSVSAPEPASLTAPLTTSTLATAPAVLAYSHTQTTVLQWPDTWKPVGSRVIAAGTPCSNVALVSGDITYRTIQAMGSLRRCV